MKNKKNKFTKSMFLASATFIVATFMISNNANALDLKALGSSNKGNITQKSARITANSMDIDVNNNVAKIIGNVYIDHPEMTISCQKMIINLEDKKEPQNTKKIKDKKKKNTAGVSGFNFAGNKKQVSTVVCIGDVIITRKIFDEAEKAKGAQTAKSGKAVLDVQNSIITFTEDNPILSRGEDSVKGDIITIFINDNRLKVDGKSIISIDVNEGRKDYLEENPKVPKKNSIITSDSSDINLNKNIAHFMGKVKIDDAMADLNCQKMDIYLSEDKELAATDRSSIKYFQIDGKDKTIDQIVCVGDVVLKRHLYSEGDIAGGEQKATAEKAVFTNEDSNIILTGTPDKNPIISRGGTLTTGSKITINVKSQKIKYLDFSGEVPTKDMQNFNSK